MAVKIMLFFLSSISASTITFAENIKEIIIGAAGVEFVKTATNEDQIDIPAVLYFDSSGCLAWHSLGLKEAWQDESLDVFAEGEGNCDTTARGETVSLLREEGIDIPNESGRPLLVWYGSDAFCKRCTELRSTDWPKLLERVPEDTLILNLEWKH